jgi:hypothetical protein
MDAENISLREKLDAGETAQNSVLGKTSTPVPSVHSDDKENKDVKETQEEPIDDEAKYPPMPTKVAVGVGLALAVFLVSPPPRPSYRFVRFMHMLTMKRWQSIRPLWRPLFPRSRTTSMP